MNMCLKRREAPIGYLIDWGRGWIGAATIRASRWTVEPAGDDAPSGQDGITVCDAGDVDSVSRATISGGAPGARYTVRSHVELTDGRTASRSLTLRIGGGR